MDDFERLLNANLMPLRRFINFKINDRYDAEDVFQDVCLTATVKFDTLKNTDVFKAWLIGIAKHKCNDYYRKKSRDLFVPLESLSEYALSTSRFGFCEQSIVRHALDRLDCKDKYILQLYYYDDLSTAKIAEMLSVPVGTVKSRLYYAKEKFKRNFPYNNTQKGVKTMKKLPRSLPEYKITKSDSAPFPVKWEELQGWFVIPRLGEKLTWGAYDSPSHELTEYTDMEVVGKAEIHGIDGIEIRAEQNYFENGKTTKTERRFVAQLTDTHSRYLAESHIEDGVRKLFTFLDGDEFTNNWGFGEDNCGNETSVYAKGSIARDGNAVFVTSDKEMIDVVGRYTVTICGKSYDTVCVMDIQCYNEGVASEQYIDKNGRTVLWRRFNKNDYASDRHKKPWTELLPDNERLTVNGETYVHWYDCITTYIV
ncbi:MAG: sigma-70 family RNA polymerase sigma factor [Roseburia sp.]|nr:sigma-70 family RNA polymerase sigma factor [Roseburia sp.]